MKLKNWVRRCIPALLAMVLIVVLAVPARAADYVIKYPDDFPYEMVASDDGYTFTIDTTNSAYWERHLDSTVRYTYSGSTVTGTSQQRLIDNLTFMLYPFGKDVYVPMSGLIADSEMHFKLTFDAEFTGATEDFTMTLSYAYGLVNSDGSITTTSFVGASSQSYVVGTNVYQWNVSAYPNLSNGSTPCRIIYKLVISGIDDETVNTSVPFSLEQSSSFTFSASSDYAVQVQNSELKDRLDTMIQTQNATNEKLDGIQDSLDDMPGDIGDEIQNIIDSENDKAEQSGGDSVEQVTDVIPDYGGGFVDALGALVEAVSYGGTQAILPLPSLVIPAIGGLIPETTLWDGGELDFSEYLEIMPDNLLTLVQSLFTIAAIAFCFYELYGLISYALTLRKSGGGE